MLSGYTEYAFSKISEDRASSETFGIGSIPAPYVCRYCAPADSSRIKTTLRPSAAPRKWDRSSSELLMSLRLPRHLSEASTTAARAVIRGSMLTANAVIALRPLPMVSTREDANGPSDTRIAAVRITADRPIALRRCDSGRKRARRRKYGRAMPLATTRHISERLAAVA